MSCGCKNKSKGHVHKKPGDGTLYTEMGSAFWDT